LVAQLLLAQISFDMPVAPRHNLEIFSQSALGLPEDMSILATGFPMDHKEIGYNRKTKIICTMGPSCWEVDMLCKLMEAGMNCARLNFSHGSHEAHGACVERLHEAMQRMPDKHVGILLDTKGPEIRTGFFKEECGGKIELKQGQDLKLVTDYDYKGDSTCFACTYQALPTSVKPGNQILMADGSVVLEVKQCNPNDSPPSVDCIVMNNAKIGERKNMNLPGVHVDLPVLGDKDKEDILNFGIPQGVNYIAASFVQSGKDVDDIRELLGRRGRHIKIISKIENEAGLKNFDDILEKTDGIMVARGDLGMEIPTEKVFLAQKTMIAKCNVAGKLVVTATQMLESMTGNPRPTRAEASDVANAVLDGSDVVMLSGETAGGAFPLNAVATMRRICETAEESISYKHLFEQMKDSSLAKYGHVTVPESVCSAAVLAVIDCEAKLIIVLTETGQTARLVSKYRPSVPILALSAAESAVKQLSLHRGIVALQVASFQGTENVLKSAMETAKSMGLVSVGDSCVCIHGVREEVSGSSNLLKIVEVS
jgi:pyruvate kinase